jgi:hypothetical protein
MVRRKQLKTANYPLRTTGPLNMVKVQEEREGGLRGAPMKRGRYGNSVVQWSAPRDPGRWSTPRIPTANRSLAQRARENPTRPSTTLKETER